MEKIKQYVIVVLVFVVSIVAAYGAGYYLRKPEVVTKTETQVVEKIVEKKVFVKDNTKTDVLETKPDGTTVHTVTQNDVVVAAQDTQIDTSISQKTEKTETKVELPKYSVGVKGQVSIKDRQLTPEFSAGYRFWGPMWLDGSYNKSLNSAGLGIRIDIK